jgi:hypothetical protein
VPAQIHASSVGVYGPGPKDRAVDESWHTDGSASRELFETVLRIPLIDCARAPSELGRDPGHTALDAVTELLHGMRHGTGAATAPLAGPKVG